MFLGVIVMIGIEKCDPVRDKISGSERLLPVIG